MELEEIQKEQINNEETRIDTKENQEVENELGNKFETELGEVTIEEKQNKFLEGTLGKVINTGVDIALRAVLPNAIEDEVIDIKNVILTDGFKEGIKAAISAASNIGKSITGIFTGKFDSVSQAYTCVKSGGLIDSASKLVDSAVKAAQDNKLIKASTAKVIKKSKNVVKDCISSKIEENFMEQVDGVEKVGKYINNWNSYLYKRDLDGMKREYNKIVKKLDNLMPIETTLKQARIIENIQTLIKNKGGTMENITEEEIRLAQNL